MDGIKNKDLKRNKNTIAAMIAGIVLAVIVGFYGNSVAQEDKEGGAVQEGQGPGSGGSEEVRGKVFNRYDREMGMVDPQGKISNTYGANIGSVDSDGTVFNISNIIVGKISNDGTISNQSGTVLGKANEKGEIFNVSGYKLGEVKGVSDVLKVGAVGRLIFFRKN